MNTDFKHIIIASLADKYINLGYKVYCHDRQIDIMFPNWWLKLPKHWFAVWIRGDDEVLRLNAYTRGKTSVKCYSYNIIAPDSISNIEQHIDDHIKMIWQKESFLLHIGVLIRRAVFTCSLILRDRLKQSSIPRIYR